MTEHEVIDGGLVAQLHALYAERERLHATIGTADADDIIALIASLEAQLIDLYGEKLEAAKASGDPDATPASAVRPPHDD